MFYAFMYRIWMLFILSLGVYAQCHAQDLDNKKRTQTAGLFAFNAPDTSALPNTSSLEANFTPIVAHKAHTRSPLNLHISGKILKLAAIYANFQEMAYLYSTNPPDNVAIINARLMDIGAYTAEQISSGSMAYGAIIAAQNPDFARSIYQAEKLYGRAKLLEGLRNLGYARKLKGGKVATYQAFIALNADAEYLRTQAFTINEQAYVLQKQPWAQKRIYDARKLADNLTSSGQQPKILRGRYVHTFTQSNINTLLYDAGFYQNGSLWAHQAREQYQEKQESHMISGVNYARWKRSETQLTRFSMPLIAPQHTAQFDRILTLAALSILEKNGEVDTEILITETLKDPIGQECVKWAQMQFRQCVGVSRYGYERPYCLSEHMLSDVANCVSGETHFMGQGKSFTPSRLY